MHKKLANQPMSFTKGSLLITFVANVLVDKTSVYLEMWVYLGVFREPISHVYVWFSLLNM